MAQAAGGRPAAVYVRFLANSVAHGLQPFISVVVDPDGNIAADPQRRFNSGYVMPVNTRLNRVGDAYQRLYLYAHLPGKAVQAGSKAPEHQLFAHDPAKSVDFGATLYTPSGPIQIYDLLLTDDENDPDALAVYRHDVDAKERDQLADAVCKDASPAFVATPPPVPVHSSPPVAHEAPAHQQYYFDGASMPRRQSSPRRLRRVAYEGFAQPNW